MDIKVLNGSVGKAERQTFVTTAGTMTPTATGPSIVGSWLPAVEKMKSESKDGKKWADKWVVARFVCPAMLADVPGLGSCILSLSAIRTDGDTAVSVLAEPVTMLADGTFKRRAPGAAAAPIAAPAAPAAAPADMMAVMRQMMAEMAQMKKA